jgi:hypothetical protein
MLALLDTIKNNNMKKTFNIVETLPALIENYYTVEAETEAQAIEMIENGDVIVEDSEIHYNYSEAEFEVEEVDNSDEDLPDGDPM